ncbi:MAG: glycine betaine ABC transporter substrate-binding protein [Spirochaetales bacterium]|nr:glycine betaine ABC transporter substrate-binding protein [Spirochaetales bacterium]
MKKRSVLFLFLLVVTFFPACKKEKSKVDDSNESKEISIVYVEWDCARASSYVLKEVLEEQGYKVKLSSSLAAMMWQGIKTGTQDLLVCAWLPTTHADYYEDALDGDIEDLGANYNNAKIGLVVPAYVDIDSIDELAANADKFDGEIIGIDPGAGIMKKTEAAIDSYSLGMRLVSSSGAAMTSVLQQKINNQEWVVVTGWAPHWKFARWDLKFLEDPKGVYGGSETINTVTRAGFLDDYPELRGLLERFSWDAATLGDIMAMNAVEGSNPAENAKIWIEKNPEIVLKWIGENE